MALNHYPDLMQTGNGAPQAIITALEEVIAYQALLPNASKSPLLLLDKGNR